MDTSELLRRAWEAVEQSGVPESLHDAAFREAVEDLRAREGEGSSAAREQQQERRSRGRGRTPKGGAKAATEEKTALVDKDTFFANLAHESGVPEADLHDVLSLSGGNVHVTQPTRNLGTNTAQQARTIIALVGAARAFGLGERPIDAVAVRNEVKRRNCYDQANYAAKHLAELKGFNPGGSSSEMVTTSKWVGEFTAAVNRALGRDKGQN